MDSRLTSVDVVKQRLPPIAVAPYRSEPDKYGASHVIARRLGMKRPPFCDATWTHGPMEHETVVRHIRQFASYQCSRHLVSTAGQCDYLRARGVWPAHAVGCPILYAGHVQVDRIRDSLLIMPGHSLPYNKPRWDHDAYVREVARLKGAFAVVVACIHQSCVDEGAWPRSFEKYGIPWIVGASAADSNALIRMVTLFKTFEFMTTNDNGSHVPYASYYGCRVFFCGPYAVRRVEDYAESPFFREHPDLLAERIAKADEHYVRQTYPQFFVGPGEAGQHIEWGGEILGAAAQQPLRRLARLLGWGIERRAWGYLRNKSAAVRRRFFG